MTHAEKLSWEQQRVKGRNHFLLRSIMREGVPFGICMTAFNILWSLWKHYPLDPIWSICAYFALCTGVFGYGMGWSAWHKNEANYNKETEGDGLT